MKGILLILCLVSASAPAEEALFGAAALIGAATPMVTSAIQASADKSIAQTNSQTAIATSLISADTSKFMADLQAQTTYSQLAAAMNINAINQQGTTDRLMMQLNSLNSARHDNLLMERERMNMEWNLNQQRMGWAYQQAASNASLGRLTLSAQLAQAGMGGKPPLAPSAYPGVYPGLYPGAYPGASGNNWGAPQYPSLVNLPVSRVFNPTRSVVALQAMNGTSIVPVYGQPSFLLSTAAVVRGGRFHLNRRFLHRVPAVAFPVEVAGSAPGARIVARTPVAIPVVAPRAIAPATVVGRGARVRGVSIERSTHAGVR
ncbi:MAG: hypothetical protein HYR96_14950 [Deltaproteobacteria bacterium]|nr:hypothetical protein [Deltaproteobacteria bacterium]MBI3293668.1 hypothetical protein [Deltaproteobacteria bacterium]